MKHLGVGVLVVVFCGACNSLLGIPDATQSSRVGGQVRGLWQGADGVALRLQADGVDTLLTASANGAFSFDTRLVPGTSYTVTVITNPVHHTCVVDGDGNGAVAEEDVTSISVACTGAAVSITLSTLSGWRFDPTEQAQTIAGSVAMQEVSLTVNGEVSSASVDGAPLRLGEASPRISLPLGQKTVAVALATNDGLSTSYQLTFDRGAAILEQLAYGKASNTGAGDFFGESLSLSGDTLAIGALYEASAATGVNGNQADNSASRSGAVYLLH